MVPIDYNPIILAIIALLSTIIVTLIPVAVTAFVTVHTAKLIQLKALADKNQGIANGIVAVVQNVYKTYTNSEKFQVAFEKLNEQLHLPAGQLQQLIEQAVSGLTLAWGDSWTALGETTGANPAINLPEPPVA